MKKSIKFFVLGMMLIIIAGCGSQGEAGETDSIKIGSMFELTGSAAA